MSQETLKNTLINMNNEIDDVIQYVEGSVFSAPVGRSSRPLR